MRRAGDVAARYGGEEFVVLLTETGEDEAVKVAEKIRAGVESLGIPHKSSGVADADVVTVSAGFASAVPERNRDPMGTVGEADRLLYKAKMGGRNRVECA